MNDLLKILDLRWKIGGVMLNMLMILLVNKTKFKSKNDNVDKDTLEQCIADIFSEDTDNDDMGDIDAIDREVIEEGFNDYNSNSSKKQ